ncbi:uncharacterized protein LOC128273449 isoform X1 [Anopheles cruzii]|uniref:uncharacterized protein LOC128273449 isoform X1 n=1 Tax=Anopheles cruzii TaxID=68878 RepID=UPI0022EC8213|nr:uncharacterized protein LOC128273449 isoform X1 [Anopheles cruzii]
MYKRVSSMAILCLLFGVLATLSPFASAFQCYQCASDQSWSHCHSNAVKVTCPGSSRFSIMGEEIFLPEQRQLEPACVGVFGEGTIAGVKVEAYVRDCFYNDKTLCSALQAAMPTGVTIRDCDLCTSNLCNSANRYSIAASSLLLLALVTFLWK